MANTESLGVSGVEWLDALAAEADGCSRACIPTIADPRGTDFAKADMLKQAPWMETLGRGAIDAFVRLGVSMTDTCINDRTDQTHPGACAVRTGSLATPAS